MTEAKDPALELLAEALEGFPDVFHYLTTTDRATRLLAALRDGLAVAALTPETDWDAEWAEWGGRWQWLVRGPDGSAFGDTLHEAIRAALDEGGAR